MPLNHIKDYDKIFETPQGSGSSWENGDNNNTYS